MNFTEEQKEEIKRIWEGKRPKKMIERSKKEGYRLNQEKYYVPVDIQGRINRIRKIAGVLPQM